jgi:hypothetical protein
MVMIETLYSHFFHPSRRKILLVAASWMASCQRSTKEGHIVNDIVDYANHGGTASPRLIREIGNPANADVFISHVSRYLWGYVTTQVDVQLGAPTKREIALRKKKAFCAGNVRDIIGNPFNPPRAGPAEKATWLAPEVQHLATEIYHRREKGLPILADMIEEAGCQRQDILDHLRSWGPHFPGCWALDLILGNS